MGSSVSRLELIRAKGLYGFPAAAARTPRCGDAPARRWTGRAGPPTTRPARDRRVAELGAALAQLW